MLIYGIGTDLIKKARIAKMFARYSSKFATRILSISELVIFKQHKQPLDYLAKRFAAKEALVKALGTGFREQVYFKNISILSDNLGKPIIEFSGQTQQYVNTLGRLQFEISISDDEQYALAFVIIARVSLF